MWKDSIQRLFRYRKITPSPTLWEQLEAQLAESEAQQARQNSRKVWYCAIAACLLLCLGIGYLLEQLQNNTYPEYQSQKVVVLTTEKENASSVGTTFTPTTITETLKVPIIQRTLTTLPAVKSSIASPALLDINEVDTLFAQYTADVIETRITKQMEKQIAGDLQQLSAEDLALIATTQAQLNQYVNQKYEQDATFNTIERDLLRNRVKLLAERLLKEVGTRVVLNNKD